MAAGFVAAFIQHEGQWLGHWLRYDRPRLRRATVLAEARADLARHFAIYRGGEALAARQMVVVDGLCPNGRALIESLFEALRGQSTTPAP